MVLKLIHVWNTALGNGVAVSLPTAHPSFDDGDELQPDEELVARRLTDEADALQRREVERRRGEKKDREDGDYLLLVVWLASEEYRQVRRQLLNDVADAEQAVHLAYSRAVIEASKTQEALEAVQGHAIVLSDGRRVYFTRDGRALFGEDLQKITDAATIEEAGHIHAVRPDAPDFETYADKYQKANDAAERARQLADTSRKLEELNQKVKAGELTPDELERARNEAQEIIDSLPEDARKDYERLHAAKQSGDVAYRGPDTAAATASSVDAQLNTAGSQRQPSGATDAAAGGVNRLPAYRGPAQDL